MTSVLFFMEWSILHCRGDTSESSRKRQNMQKTWLLHELFFFLGRAHIQWYAYIGKAYLDEFFTWVYICITTTENEKLHLWSLKALNPFWSSPHPREPPSWFLSPREVLPVPGFHTEHTFLSGLFLSTLSVQSVHPRCPGFWYLHFRVVFLCVDIPPLIHATFYGRLCMSWFLGGKLLWTFLSTSIGDVNTLVHVFG